MKSYESYSEAAKVLTSVVGDWDEAAEHLRDVGWSVEDWQNWVNECQCGIGASPRFGLVQSFRMSADEIGLPKNLRGNDDDVATWLGCLFLWITLDDLMPDDEPKVLDLIVKCLRPTASLAAA